MSKLTTGTARNTSRHVIRQRRSALRCMRRKSGCVAWSWKMNRCGKNSHNCAPTKRDAEAIVPNLEREPVTMTSRPPLPPFTQAAAIQKVRLAEDDWNTRHPEKESLATHAIHIVLTVSRS